MGFLGVPLGYIMNFIYSFISNYGMSLLLFILITKIMLLPVAIKQQKTTAKTAAFQPKLKALQKKYGTDKARYQEEMMKLYEQEGINPAGGCFPMLIQMVLLFGIIDVIYNPLIHILRLPMDLVNKAAEVLSMKGSIAQINIIQAIQTGNEKVANVFTPDVVNQIKSFDMNFLGINLGEQPSLTFNLLLLIPVICGVTALLSSYISMKQQKMNGQEMMGSMKAMMYIMPLFSVVIAFSYPAGVGLYWTFSNIFAIIQSIILYKFYSPEKVMNMVDKSADKNRAKMKARREKAESYRTTTTPNKPYKHSEIAAGESQRLAEARKRMEEKYKD